MNKSIEQALKSANKNGDRPTPKMQKYLADLLHEFGVQTSAVRRAFLFSHIDREVFGLDELTFSEAHELIDSLKEQRDRTSQKTKEEDDDWINSW